MYQWCQSPPWVAAAARPGGEKPVARNR